MTLQYLCLGKNFEKTQRNFLGTEFITGKKLGNKFWRKSYYECLQRFYSKIPSQNTCPRNFLFFWKRQLFKDLNH